MEQQRKPKGYPEKTGGGLWTHQKRNNNAPDMKGNVEITKVQVQQLIQMAKMGRQPQLSLAAWSKQDQSGQYWMSLSADVYKAADEQTAQPTAAPQPMAAPPPPPPPPQPVAPPPPPPVAPQPVASFPVIDDDIPF